MEFLLYLSNLVFTMKAPVGKNMVTLRLVYLKWFKLKLFDQKILWKTDTARYKL